MADFDPTFSREGPFESLQHQSAHARRVRPPDIDMVVGDENRVPLRPEKLSRRESRLGLRNIFGRSKAAKEADFAHMTLAAQREINRPGGIRASLVEISNWPYGLHAHAARPETATPITHLRPVSTASNLSPIAEPARPIKSSGGGKPKSPSTAVRSPRGHLATWDPPPLFQAYPQAIRHAQLPASTISADAILRLLDRKGSGTLREDLNQASLAPDLADDQALDKASEKARKKHRRNLSGLDWTTKIYVLCTSGYLLQYAGEGHFDRLPEKMLQLGKDSAAFASDIIPGRHWVLQVSSVMDADGTQATDSRSLFSRLPFRGPEKRQASNFLMVFESAEEMETWITTLRREIEALGGKKNLSETGRPKADDHVLELRARPSQRTLITRDPDRFSRVIPTDFSLPNDHNLDDMEGSVTVVDSDGAMDQSLDDASTTNSMVSTDGRHLESLRDSANRLSYMSSGQRTIVTSANSSPACSPTRNSFASQHDELSFQDLAAEVRLRPNAADIADRRQSMMNMNFVDMRGPMASTRPLSGYSPASTEQHQPGSFAIPNFSVPNLANRRYSYVKTPPLDSAPFMPEAGKGREIPVRTARKPPPTSLSMSRPLSIVADQPSPLQEPEDFKPDVSARPSSRHTSSDVAAVRDNKHARADSARSLSSTGTGSEFPSRRSSLAPREQQTITLTVRTSPRKYASMHSLRHSSESDMHPGMRTFILPPKVPPLPRNPGEETLRCKSSTDTYGRSRSRSPSARPKSSHQKGASVASERPSRYSMGPVSDIAVRIQPTDPDLMPRYSLFPPSRPSPAAVPSAVSTQHLRVDSGSQRRALLNRRSMPQLVEGPPPAPPPTCALPPIPQKMRNKA